VRYQVLKRIRSCIGASPGLGAQACFSQRTRTSTQSRGIPLNPLILRFVHRRQSQSVRARRCDGVAEEPPPRHNPLYIFSGSA